MPYYASFLPWSLGKHPYTVLNDNFLFSKNNLALCLISWPQSSFLWGQALTTPNAQLPMGELKNNTRQYFPVHNVVGFWLGLDQTYIWCMFPLLVTFFSNKLKEKWNWEYVCYSCFSSENCLIFPLLRKL